MSDGLIEITPNRAVIQCGWDHVPHLDAATKAATLESYPEHERECRSTGVPGLGSGAIYPYPDSRITYDPFTVRIQKYWPKCYGLDVGWRMTAAVWGAMDPDSGIIYIYSDHYEGGQEPVHHAAAIKSRGEWIPGVIDPSADRRNSDDGERLLAQYRSHGLQLDKAKNAVEAGLYAVREKFLSGMLKISTLCQHTLQERRFYRRDEEGKIIKEDDHAMDALRYLIMSGVEKMITEPSATEQNYYGVRSHAGY